jgi:hypothetical protein
MERKIYKRLLKWKQEEKGAVALLIDGARRVDRNYLTPIKLARWKEISAGIFFICKFGKIVLFLQKQVLL